MIDLVAKELFLTRGIGVHEDKLTSFGYALRDAGIAGTNIVLISSIFPPKAKLIPKKEGLKKIKPGQILFTIYSINHSEMYESNTFTNGITNGAQWYAIFGGMQDWNYVWEKNFDITYKLIL